MSYHEFNFTWNIKSKNNFTAKVLSWISQFSTFVYLDNNEYKDPYGKYELLIAIDVHEIIKDFNHFKHNSWTFIQIPFPSKQEHSISNYFIFRPKIVIAIPKNSNEGKIYSIDKTGEKILNEIYQQNCSYFQETEKFTSSFLKSKDKGNWTTSYNEYKQKVLTIQNSIKNKECKEVNLCVEYKWNTDLKNKEVLFYNLNQSNPCPFATFMRKDNTYIFSTSPERFFTIDYPYIHSQPIKGTIKRGKNAQEDVIKMQKLKNDPKELNENHIIANMVINEFQTLDCCSSVTLIEDAVLYSFPKLHHLISTIRGEYNTYKEIETLAFNAFAALFPMGSMTGTPKNHVLNIIHDIEDSERGYYSGTIGYIDPDNKIDSNVIIRTLIYDDERKLASFHVGGAITLETNAKREWKEIILKSEFLK